MGPKKPPVAEEEAPVEQDETDHGPQLPLNITATTPDTLVFMLQTKEEEIAVKVHAVRLEGWRTMISSSAQAAKAVLKFVEDAWTEKKPEHHEESAGKGKKGKGKEVHEEVSAGCADPRPVCRSARALVLQVVDDHGADKQMIHSVGGIPVM